MRGDHPRVPVGVTAYPNESDLINVPIPDVPSIEGAFTDALPTLADMDNGDHHLLIVVRDEATGGIAELIEMWKAWHDVAGWHAASLALFDIKSGLPRPDGWTSSDAAGLPRVPLMIRFDECRSPLGIQHPLAITFGAGNCRNRYIWPARHAALNGPVDDGIPYGGRLRLRQDWYDANKDRYTSDARVIVEALRVYGAMNVDIAVDMFLLGISDSRFSQANLMTLQDIPADAFEVLKMIPQFELVGPTSAPVGVDTTYTLKLNPVIELNGASGNYYFHAYEQGPAGDWVRLPDDATSGIKPHNVNYNDPAPLTIVFKARQTGPHLIEVDQSGNYKLEWIPATQPIPARGPYPYFKVDVT